MTRHDTISPATVEHMTPATVDIRRMDGGRRSTMAPVTVDTTDPVEGLKTGHRVRVYTVPSVVRDIMDRLSDTVDGATVTDGRGWWNDPVEGRMTSEESATVEVVTTDPVIVAAIVDAATVAATVHGESAVMVTVDPVRTVTIWTDPVAAAAYDTDPAARRMVTT